jgi:hypothetical protein
LREGNIMHTQHEGKESPGVVSMVVVSGLFIIGKMVGGNKVLDPRVFTLFDEPQNDGNGNPIPDPKTGRQLIIPKMKLSPLPCLPPHIVGKFDLIYPIPEDDKKVLDLYKKVTMPIDPTLN